MTKERIVVIKVAIKLKSYQSRITDIIPHIHFQSYKLQFPDYVNDLNDFHVNFK